jgi:hypothetical protein
LLRRKVIIDPTCPICGREAESGSTVFHILWDCASARDVWCWGPVFLQKSSYVGPSFMQVVEGIFQRGENDDIRLFVGVARRLWLRRNEFIHDGFFANPDRVMQGACQVMEEFQLIAAQSIYH